MAENNKFNSEEVERRKRMVSNNIEEDCNLVTTSLMVKDPREQIPIEVWMQIFDKLPHDGRYACFQVCSDFEAMLKKSRISFLFPMILPRLEGSITFDYDYEGNKVAADIFNLRLVSSSWKKAVDDECQLLRHCTDSASYTEVERPAEYLLGTVSEIEKFVGLMEKRPFPERNPFISRSVEFDDLEVDANPDGEPGPFLNAVHNLLKVYGRHIWYCKLNMTETSVVNFASFYGEILVRFSSLMPNLKELHLKNVNLFHVENESQGRIEELLNSVDEPMPRFSNLTLLIIENVPSVLTKHFVQTFCEPQTLEDLKVCPDASNCVDVIRGFTNLTSVHFEKLCEADFSHLEEVSWSLFDAELHIQFGWAQNSLTLDSLFQWLSRFGDTLRALRLILDRDEGKAIFDNVLKLDLTTRLILPKLKVLKLTTNGKTVEINTLDFVQGLPDLDFLAIDMSGATFEKDNPQGVIKFVGYVPKMLESNLWEVCPKLEYLMLKDDDLFYRYYWGGSPEASRAVKVYHRETESPGQRTEELISEDEDWIQRFFDDDDIEDDDDL